MVPQVWRVIVSTNFETLKEYLNADKQQEAAMLLIGLCPILRDCNSCDSCILKIAEWGQKTVSESCSEKNCRELTKLITELKTIVEMQKELITKQ